LVNYRNVPYPLEGKSLPLPPSILNDLLEKVRKADLDKEKKCERKKKMIKGKLEVMRVKFTVPVLYIGVSWEGEIPYQYFISVAGMTWYLDQHWH
jgi:hypothetical protein